MIVFSDGKTYTPPTVLQQKLNETREAKKKKQHTENVYVPYYIINKLAECLSFTENRFIGHLLLKNQILNISQDIYLFWYINFRPYQYFLYILYIKYQQMRTTSLSVQKYIRTRGTAAIQPWPWLRRESQKFYSYGVMSKHTHRSYNVRKIS